MTGTGLDERAPWAAPGDGPVAPDRPGGLPDAAGGLLDAVRRTLDLDDLRPSPRVNSTLSALVAAVLAAPDGCEGLVPPAERLRVQRTAGAAEAELEAYWAVRIAGADDPRAAAARFPYAGNYRALVARELEVLRATGAAAGPGTRVLVVGSGPLPLTGLELAGRHGADVTHVDASPRALELGARVRHALALPGRELLGDGATVRPGGPYDLVMIAALVGEDLAAKQQVVDNVVPLLAPGGRLLLRSAHGARALLYPVVPPHGPAGVHLLAEHHPRDEIVNSVLVYGAGDRPAAA